MLSGLATTGVLDARAMPPVPLPGWVGGDGAALPLLQRVFVERDVPLLHGASFDPPETLRLS